MLGLPVATELHKQIAKNLLYTRCGLNTAEQNVINRDISKITIVHEISPARVHIAEGTKVTAVFVLLIHLKRKDFLEKVSVLMDDDTDIGENAYKLRCEDASERIASVIEGVIND